MFEVEIKVKRIDEFGVYYEIVPIGELSDKLSYCDTHTDLSDEEVCILAKQILNDNYANLSIQ
jgi:hypothetical protein